MNNLSETRFHAPVFYTFETFGNSTSVTILQKFSYDSSIWTLVSVVGFVVAVLKFRTKDGHSKSNLPPVPKFIPSPPSLPFVGPLLQIIWHGQDFHRLMHSWATKYGEIFQLNILGKRLVLLNNTELIQKVLTSTNPGHMKKPAFIYNKMFEDVMRNGLFASKVSVWKPHRTILFKAFAYGPLKSYLPLITLHSRRLVAELSDKSSSKTFSDLIHVCAIRIITHIVTGSDIADDEESYEFHKNLCRAEAICTNRLFRPWLLWEPVWNLHPHSREFKQVVGGCRRFIYKIINNYRSRMQTTTESELGNSEILSYQNAMEVMIQAGLPDEEIFSEVVTLIVGGHETISVTLNFFMFNLALNPDHQKICREEVDAVFSSLEQSPSKQDIEVDIDSLNNMKYLERCFKESLRIIPTVPGFARELDVPLDFGNDIVLGAGVTVITAPYLLHMNPKLYPNPMKFDPDRFTLENTKQRHSYAYVPFSSGARNCIGWKLAMLEAKLIAAWLLRHFEIETKDKMEDIRLQVSITLLPGKNIDFVFKERDLPR